MLKPGDQVLIHRPYHDSDGPIPKIFCLWNGPYTVTTKLTPIIYRVPKQGTVAETTVHLSRRQKLYSPVKTLEPDLEVLDGTFLGTSLPVPHLKGSLTQVTIGPFTVESIEGRKRGVGAASLANFQYHQNSKIILHKLGVWGHVMVIPQCREMVESYRAVFLSQDPAVFNPPTRQPRP